MDSENMPYESSADYADEGVRMRLNALAKNLRDLGFIGDTAAGVGEAREPDMATPPNPLEGLAPKIRDNPQ